MYHEAGSASLCQLDSQQKRQRRRVSSFGIRFKGMYISFFKVINDVHMNTILRGEFLSGPTVSV